LFLLPGKTVVRGIDLFGIPARHTTDEPIYPPLLPDSSTIFVYFNPTLQIITDFI
jgi:hypothetical protein